MIHSRNLVFHCFTKKFKGNIKNEWTIAVLHTMYTKKKVWIFESFTLYDLHACDLLAVKGEIKFAETQFPTRANYLQ